MAWTSGTQTVTPGASGQDVLTLLETAMTAAGWTFVEEYLVWRVWKNPVAVNGTVDFYVGFQSDGAGNLWGFLAEEYDATLHKVRRSGWSNGSSVSTSGNWDATTGSYLGATWYTLTNATSITGIGIQIYAVAMTSSFDYLIRVGTRHLTFTARSGATISARWIGLFDSTIANAATADPVPLAAIDMNNTPSVYAPTNAVSPYGIVTRCPAPVTHTTWRYLNQAAGGLAARTDGSPGAANNTSGVGAGGLGASNDAWSNPTMIGPLIMACSMDNSGFGTALGYVRGRYPGLVTGPAGSGVVVGDEFTFESNTYSVLIAANTRFIAAQKTFAL